MKTILIIDDEPEILGIVKEQLEILEYHLHILTAVNVKQVEEQIHLADLILADINVPAREVLEKQLRECGVPVGKMSGHVEYTGPHIIHKPFVFEEFQGLIDHLISQASDRSQKDPAA